MDPVQAQDAHHGWVNMALDTIPRMRRSHEAPSRTPDDDLPREEAQRTLRARLASDVAEGHIEPPLLPSVALELMRLTSTGAADPRDLAALIERDQMIAAKLLRAANSAMFAASREITSLGGAVNRLGVLGVRDVVLAIALKGIVVRDEPYHRIMVRLWEHALACAAISKLVAGLARVPTEEAFLAGLLHDIGKPTLLISLMTMNQETGGDLRDVGRAMFRIEALIDEFHTAAGTLVAERWLLPTQCRLAIAHHHAPNASRIVRVVHVADETSRALTAEREEGAWPAMTEDRIRAALEHACLALSQREFETLLIRADKAREDAVQAFA